MHMQSNKVNQMNQTISCIDQDTWEKVLQLTDTKYFKANVTYSGPRNVVVIKVGSGEPQDSVKHSQGSCDFLITFQW